MQSIKFCRRAYFLFLCVLNLSFSSFLIASETVTRNLTWKPVAGAGGYIVELREKNGPTLWQKETDNPEVTLVLSEGDYEFRIAALNRFGKNPVFSRWMSIQVRLARPPVVQAEPLPTIPPDAKVAVQGSSFSRDIQVFLSRADNRIRVEQVFRKSESELEFSIPPGLAPGSYDLVLENPRGRSRIIENYLMIPDTRKVVEGGRSAVLWRSALLPGWGQFHAGNTIKAYATATLFTAAAGFYIYSEINFFSKENYYQKLRGDVYSSSFRRKLFAAKDSYAAAADLQNIAVFMLAGVYVLNLLDAAFFNGPYSRDELQSLSTLPKSNRLVLALTSDGAVITLRHYLP